MTDLETDLVLQAAKLDDAHNVIRKDAAASFVDLFDHLIISGIGIDPNVYSSVVEKLLQHALSDDIFEVREFLFSALVDAACAQNAIDFDWSALAHVVHSIDVRLLDIAIAILSFTHDKSFEPLIYSFCKHDSTHIRQVANDALIELLGRK